MLIREHNDYPPRIQRNFLTAIRAAYAYAVKENKSFLYDKGSMHAQNLW